MLTWQQRMNALRCLVVIYDSGDVYYFEAPGLSVGVIVDQVLYWLHSKTSDQNGLFFV